MTILEWIELLAVGFSAVQVVLAGQNKISNYIFGFIGTVLTTWIFFNTKLYAEMLLNTYYAVMSVYGYYQWRWGKNHEALPISTAQLRDWGVSLFIVLSSFGIFYAVLSRFTDSDVPFVDAIVSALAWAGMWLMARRKIENWIVLNLSNLISIPLLLHKDLKLYAGYTIFLFVMAVVGFLKWRRIMRETPIKDLK